MALYMNLFRFIVFILIAFTTNVKAENIAAIPAEIPYKEGEALCIYINKEERDKVVFYEVDFAVERDRGEGASLTVFPNRVGNYIAYLKSLHKIPGKYSGNALLEAIEQFCRQMGIEKVFLSDESELEIGMKKSISLRDLHILTSPDHTSWYESKGYRVITDETARDWLAWLTADKEQDLLTFAPITHEYYRVLVENFVNLPVKKYLQSLKATELFSKHAKRMKKLLKEAPSGDVTLSELAIALEPDLRYKLMIELDNPLATKKKVQKFLTRLARDKKQTPSIRYAKVLMMQWLLRGVCQSQTPKERDELYKEVQRFFQGHQFTYKRDLSTFAGKEMPPSDEKNEALQFVEIALNFLADQPCQLFKDVGFDSVAPLPNTTVRKAVGKLRGDARKQFLAYILFGTATAEYYPFVCSFIDKLQTSSNSKEFVFGYLLNQMLLEEATILEQSFQQFPLEHKEQDTQG